LKDVPGEVRPRRFRRTLVGLKLAEERGGGVYAERFRRTLVGLKYGCTSVVR